MITVYPRVWSISDHHQSFIGVTSKGKRKQFLLPQRKSRYDRHQWGMFHWFQGHILDSEFIIERIVEQSPPQFKTAKIKYWQKDNLVHAEIGNITLEADSIDNLNSILLTYVKEQEIDILYTNQKLNSILDNALIKYLIYSHEGMYTDDQIRTYCNVLSCVPRELNSMKSIHPTLCRLGILNFENYNLTDNINANFERQDTPSGEYRDIIAYNISNIYVEELSKSDDDKIQTIARVMQDLNSLHRALFFHFMPFPQELIDNVKKRVRKYNPICFYFFEIKVRSPIEDPSFQKINEYDYLLQIARHKRVTLHKGQVKIQGYASTFPYLLKLLETIAKNWYLQDKSLPEIPDKFEFEDIVVDRIIHHNYHQPLNLLQICQDHNIPTDEKVPCIRIRPNRDWPLILYDPADPSKPQQISDYYWNYIRKLYDQLRNI